MPEGDATQAPAPAPRRAAGSIAVNTALNLVGLVAPLLAAVIAIPLLNRHLGTARVGFLTLAWALIGYFSLFDLGIGRALTKLVAEHLPRSDDATVSRLIWSALSLMLALGVVAGGAMALAAHWLVESALKIPPELQGEAVTAIHILAFTVPLVVTSAGLRGVLEAQGRFLVSNAIRAPLGIWMIAGPLLLLLPFASRSLAWVAVILLVGRVAATTAYVSACLRGLPALRAHFGVERSHVRALLLFGGWMTVSNIVSPLMVYMDRFLLGNRISLQAVAWYATPFEVVTKVLVLPSAIVTVLFPLFSALASSSREESARIHRLGVRYVGLLLFPVTLGIALFAREGLGIWVGDEFASHSFRVAQLIALGCLLNGIANVPFAVLQGAGRPDITAKAHLIELPVYVVLVLVLTSAFGITGTAAAWALRVGLDLVVLELLALRLEGVRPRHLAYAKAIVAGAGVFAMAFLPLPLSVRAVLFAVVLFVEAYVVWAVLLERDGLSAVKGRVRALHRRSHSRVQRG